MEHDLPRLDVVPLSRLVLHEDSDPLRVARIRKALLHDRTLKNPPIAGLTPGNRRMIVLDGANRVTAARELGLPHFLVQIVEYDSPAIRLGQWHHLLVRFDPEELLAGLGAIRGAKLVRLSRRGGAASGSGTRPVAGKSASVIRIRGRGSWALRPLGTRRSVPALLREVTAIYRERTPIYRIADEELDFAARQFEDVTAVVLFPRFTKRQIVNLSLRRREKLPTGITKHRIPQRALRVHLPLSILRSRVPLGRKQARLRAFLTSKVRERRVRFYAESTVLYDE